MYSPALFREDDAARLHALIQDHSFGTLIVPTSDGLDISHLPFLLDRSETGATRLRAHVARGNRIGMLAAEGRPATVVFHGPHSYISAGWYETPTEQVPTWNYAVVHVHGRLSGPMDEAGLRSLLGELAEKHEGADPRWSVESLASGVLDKLLPGIVGFTIEIERMEGKFKLSQNRSMADQARVIAGLNERRSADDLRVAGMMSERLNAL